MNPIKVADVHRSTWWHHSEQKRKSAHFLQNDSMKIVLVVKNIILKNRKVYFSHETFASIYLTVNINRNPASVD